MKARYVTRDGLVMRVGSPAYKWWQQNRHRIYGIIASVLPAVELPPLVQAASPNFSARSTPVNLVVIHDTEGAYAGAVSWLRNPAAQVSAHVVLREDGGMASQLVKWSKKAWACEAFNSRSLNLEMAGKASVGYSSGQLDAAAAITAYWCKLYKIPVVYSPGGTKPGVTFHQDLGVAGGDHHDPGFTNTQKIDFVNRAKKAAARGVKPPVWGFK